MNVGSHEHISKAFQSSESITRTYTVANEPKYFNETSQNFFRVSAKKGDVDYDPEFNWNLGLYQYHTVEFTGFVENESSTSFTVDMDIFMNSVSDAGDVVTASTYSTKMS